MTGPHLDPSGPWLHDLPDISGNARSRSRIWPTTVAFRILLMLALAVAVASALVPNQSGLPGSVDPTGPDSPPPAILIQPAD